MYIHVSILFNLHNKLSYCLEKTKTNRFGKSSETHERISQTRKIIKKAIK